jgi:hypothetical protein
MKEGVYIAIIIESPVKDRLGIFHRVRTKVYRKVSGLSR